MGRQYYSRLSSYYSDTEQAANIDIIETGVGVETTTIVYSRLAATWAEKQIVEAEGLLGEVGTKFVKVFNIQPLRKGQLPIITERMRVRFTGDTDEGLKIISVNPSSGHIQTLQVTTETGRD